MAEASLRSRIPSDLVGYVEVTSAGLSTLSGLAPAVEAELAARLKKYNLANHRSKPVTEILLEESDVILCMEDHQVKALQARMPLLADRIFLLTQFNHGSGREIKDPFGQDIQVYMTTLDLLDEELDRIQPAIWEAARSKITKRITR